MNNSYKSASELLKHYGWNSIILRYWKKLVLFLLIPLISLNVIVFVKYNTALKQEINTSFQSFCAQTLYHVEHDFEYINKSQRALSADNLTTLYVLSSPEALKSSFNANTILSLREKISQTLFATNILEDIYLYSLQNDYVISHKSGTIASAFPDNQWYTYAISNNEFNFILSRDNTPFHSEGIYIAHSIRDTKKTNGMLVYVLSNNYFDSLIKDSLKTGLGSMHIIDQNNRILYSSCFNEGDILDTSSQHNTKVLSYPLYSGKLTLLFYQDPNYLHQRSFSLYGGFLLCLCLILLLPLMMTFYISVQFYSSIQKIVSCLTLDSTETESNEIDFITHNILMLTQHSKHFEKELTEKIQLLKQHQALALQFQFNPHFLFNTLEMMHVMVASYTKGPNEVNRIIMLLSELLTISLDSTDYTISLSEELEYEKKYIEILQLQHRRPFHIIWNIAENTLSCTVLRLSLQPIIENTFQHGLKFVPKNETFVIEISSKIVNNELYLLIRNNGKGVPPEKLQELRNQLNNNSMFVSKHIGLNNIHQRIQLLFGKNYGCHIDSDGQSFTVTLHMPQNQIN